MSMLHLNKKIMSTIIDSNNQHWYCYTISSNWSPTNRRHRQTLWRNILLWLHVTT